MIVFPWPDKSLTPNAKRRKHWRSYRQAIIDDRQRGHDETLAQMPLDARLAVKTGSGHIGMSITFYPPDARRRDDDGMISAFKHMRDGMADALGLDDYRFRPEYRFADPEKPGRVEVRFAKLFQIERVEGSEPVDNSGTPARDLQRPYKNGVSGLPPDQGEAA